MTALKQKIIDPKLFLFTIISVATLIACFGFVAWGLQRSHADACNARDKSLNVLSGIIFFAQTEHQPPGKKSHDPFFQYAYKQIKEARC